ncbi:MAG TPA: ECF-type sigma factor [Thermoanaerobaculia bacterium]|nr:ECF-type sigma factor [Thermoanaerobaculia bacterium]
MTIPPNTPITDLLHAWGDGDRQALDELMELVYGKLEEHARRAMARERESHTLDPAALANEVYLRLRELKKSSWEGRGQFFAFTARLMRHILAEYARAREAQKRGGEAERVTLSHPELQAAPGLSVDILDLNRVLEELSAFDPKLVRLIELRFFAGFSEEEAAEALGESRSSVQREWKVAKNFLAERLRP